MAATMKTVSEDIRDYSTLEGRSYPLQLLKSIIKEMLLGLDFLHSHNIVHGDLRPGNLLFAAKDLKHVAEEHLIQRLEKGKTVRKMSRQDGEHSQCVPRYICFTAKLSQYVDISGPRTLVKLSDLGACKFATTAWSVLEADYALVFNSSDPPEKVQTPAALRAPELVLGAAFDHRIDIWNFGYLMYEFFTQRLLFSVWSSTWLPHYRTNDSHLLQLIDALGPLPNLLFNLWEGGGRYFGPDGEVLGTDVGEEEPCPYPICIGPPLEEMFVQNRMW